MQLRMSSKQNVLFFKDYSDTSVRETARGFIRLVSPGAASEVLPVLSTEGRVKGYPGSRRRSLFGAGETLIREQNNERRGDQRGERPERSVCDAAELAVVHYARRATRHDEDRGDDRRRRGVSSQ